MALLHVSDLSKYFGGLAAVNGVSLDLFDSEILGLIGPNGAGKTTLFNVITGFLPPTSGKVIFKERDITGLKSHRIVEIGIRRTFQVSSLLMNLTVFENVFAGFHLNYRVGLLKTFLNTSSARMERKEIKQKCMEILEFMGLARLKDETAKNLPYGRQRALGMAIALTTEPTLLFLDEPVAGMNALETLETADLIRKMRERGITILLVEHDMKMVMDLCDRVTVLNYGRKIADGKPEEVRKNMEVIEAYLGRGKYARVA